VVEDPPTTTTPTEGDPTEGGEYVGCLYAPESPYQAIQHQCGGFGIAKVEFTIEDLPGYNGTYPASTYTFFGPPYDDESYEKPKVMACCNPAHDSEALLTEQPTYLACYHDLVENGCLSIWANLKKMKDEAPLLAGPQIQDLIDWVASHQQECFEEFWIASGASAWTPEDEFDNLEIDHVWELPSSAETSWIKDIKFEMENAVVNDVYIPSDPGEWIACDSQRDNNDITFLKGDPGDGNVFGLYYGDVSLAGPGTPPFSGSSDFTSIGDSCIYCSMISTSEETDDSVLIYSMTLDTTDTAMVTDGTTSVVVDRARIALYEPVEAVEVGSLYYEIPAGGATFVFSASVAGVNTIEMAVNSAVIEIEMESLLTSPGYTWTVSPFSFTYTDDNEDEWTLETGTLFFTP